MNEPTEWKLTTLGDKHYFGNGRVYGLTPSLEFAQRIVRLLTEEDDSRAWLAKLAEEIHNKELDSSVDLPQDKQK